MVKRSDRKNVLIILGHPLKDSLCGSLARAYAKGAKKTGAKVRTICLGDEKFYPVLKYGYKKRMKEEKCIPKCRKNIAWADHLVFVYPNWWGTMPSLLKGFIDRVFTPGFAFKYHKTGITWDKLLKGKSARLIVTMDAPPLYYNLVVKGPGHNMMKNAVLYFCGVKPVRITAVGPVRHAPEKKIEKWLTKVEKQGEKKV